MNFQGTWSTYIKSKGKGFGGGEGVEVSGFCLFSQGLNGGGSKAQVSEAI